MAFAAEQIIAGRYRLLAFLGEGGMGAVWSAEHLLTGRTVALKLIRPELHAQADTRTRFLREARAASLIEHPNVVEVLDAFELDGELPVIVMSLLKGETLAARLRRERRFSMAETAELLLPVVSALGAAHEKGVIHRDVKPENIYVAEGLPAATRVKVLDFGIAKLEAAPQAGVTETGVLLGTPAYMSPEQATAERRVDCRTDVWGLGVILYQCLSGRRPLEGETSGQMLMTLLTRGITPIATLVPETPDDVAALIGHMLMRERDERLTNLSVAQMTLERYTSLRCPAFGAPHPAAIADDVPARTAGPGSETVPHGIARRAEAEPAAANTTRSPQTLPSGRPSATVSSTPKRRATIAAVLVIAALIAAFTALRGGDPAAVDPPDPRSPVAGPEPRRAAAAPAAPAPAPAPVEPSAKAAVPGGAAASASTAELGAFDAGPATSAAAERARREKLRRSARDPAAAAERATARPPATSSDDEFFGRRR